jgi:1-piperideine-2-carboxylate/1-pyrroline-2-carboxylate reductase [NAD(P)H]
MVSPAANGPGRAGSHGSGIATLGSQRTGELLPLDVLMEEVALAACQNQAGELFCPPRMAVAFAGGTLLSMPVIAQDLVVHKLVTVCPSNRQLGLPTIMGSVTAYDAQSGEVVIALDGPTVTGWRTAAVTMLAVRHLHVGVAKSFLILGTGHQARYHVEAIARLYPLARVHVCARSIEQARQFCRDSEATGLQCNAVERPRNAQSVQVVIAATTSKEPVYDLSAQDNRLIVALGAYTRDAAEIASETVQASRIVVDDRAGAIHEAGDLIRAGIDPAHVATLADVLVGAQSASVATLFKSVGCAAWDLAACRTALRALRS